jgi:hypothetical protein
VAGAENLLVVKRDVFEERQQVDFLLIPRTDQVVVGLPRDRQDGRAVHLRVVQSVEKVDGAWSGCRQANAELACVFRVAACHERRRFFMSYLDERHALLTRPQCFHDAVDAVARQAEDNADAPIDQAFHQHIRGRTGHNAR